MILKLTYPEGYGDAWRPRCQHHLSDIYQRPRSQAVRLCKRFAVYDVGDSKLCQQHAAAIIFEKELATQEKSNYMYEINIEGVDKLALLKALYNNSKPHVPDFKADRFIKKDLDATYAELLLKNSFERKHPFIDYIQSCPIMVDFTSKVAHTYAYDYYNGHGSFNRILKNLENL